jgi:PadR family transcriptional regulator PadR
MNAQFKKGVLEMVLLQIIKPAPMSTYDVLKQLRQRLDVNENTIYPLLRRLEVEGYCTYDKVYGELGAPRKLFKLTDNGLEQLNQLTQQWWAFTEEVSALMKGVSHD